MADIRSFFQPTKKSKSAVSSVASPQPSAPAKRKAKALVISSDEDEEPAPKASPVTAKPNLKKLKKSSSNEKSPKGKLVDVSTAFGSEPIKRVERPKHNNRSITQKEMDTLFGDDLDEDLVLESSIIEEEQKFHTKESTSRNGKDASAKSTNNDRSSPQKTPTKLVKKDNSSPKEKCGGKHQSPRKTSTKHRKEESSFEASSDNGKDNEFRIPERRISPRKTPSKIVKSESKSDERDNKGKTSPLNGKIDKHDTETKEIKKIRNFDGDNLDDSKQYETAEIKSSLVSNSSKKSTPSRKRTASKIPDDSMTDEDHMAKKRAAMMMYEQFKNRGGPPNPGSKELPKGNPTCLSGKTFIITGVLDSMEREEAADLIRSHGGKVTTSLSKKTSYMVVGEEAGLAKLAKADELKTQILSEDGLLHLIRDKSGLKIKTEPKAQSPCGLLKKDHDRGSKHVISPKKEKNLSPQMDSKKLIKKEIHSKINSPKKIIKTEPNKDIKKEIKSEITSPKKIIKTEPNKDIKKEIKSEITSPKKIIKTEPKGDSATKRIESAHEKNIASAANQAWVDKYKPTNVKDIIGQQGPGSNVAKLTNWLTKWYINQSGGKKHARPNPWAKNDDGACFKAALLSGPPGVGKTTTASLVSKELGFDVVEFNASDTRSKKLLKEEVSELLSNKSLYGYFHGSDQAVTVKHVLLMDEVDGMAGNEDRGGIQELIALIKDSSVPIICMCNDRNHTKMRSLVNHCYDLRFNRPPLAQIKGRMSSMCHKEGFKLPPGVLDEVILATNNDIRQTINHLTLLSANQSIPAIAERSADEKTYTARKDMKMGPWDVVRKVFSAEEHKTMSLHDKADLFFHDYSLGPLFVQQNYLHVAPKVAKSEIPKHVAMAADSLSLGDLVESRIRSKMAWSMLPTQAMFSSVLPGEYMSGTFTGQIAFPGWLGKYSKSNKRNRMAQEIHDHTRIRTSGSRLSVRLDYAGFLLDKIVRPLKERGLDGVEDSLAVLKEYHLLREDLDSLIELTTWPGKKSPFDAVESKVKAALTRAYNKEITPYSYSTAAAIKKKKSDTADDEAFAGGEYGESEAMADSSDDEEDSKVENDVLIKQKKRPDAKASGSKAKTAKSTAGSSRAKPKAK